MGAHDAYMHHWLVKGQLRGACYSIEAVATEVGSGLRNPCAELSLDPPGLDVLQSCQVETSAACPWVSRPQAHPLVHQRGHIQPRELQEPVINITSVVLMVAWQHRGSVYRSL